MMTPCRQGLPGELCAGMARMIEHSMEGNFVQRYLLVAIGGALGSVTRFWVGALALERIHGRFWYGTFIINITACLLFGLVMEVLNRHGLMSSPWRYLIPIGFLGGYSTFSSFEWEIYQGLTFNALALTASYAALSLVVGLAAVYAGVAIARAIA